MARAVLVCRSYIPYGDDLNGTFGKEVEQARFELPGCDPEKTSEVFFLDVKNQLGAVAFLSGKQAGQPVTPRLRPCGRARARLMDSMGRPLANFEVDAEFVLTPGIPVVNETLTSKGLAADTAFMANLDPDGHNNLHSDARGRIAFRSLIPGATYWLVGQDPMRGSINLHKEFKVGPGQMLDLGEIRVQTPP